MHLCTGQFAGKSWRALAAITYGGLSYRVAELLPHSGGPVVGGQDLSRPLHLKVSVRVRLPPLGINHNCT